jgi:hypothetical protein
MSQYPPAVPPGQYPPMPGNAPQYYPGQPAKTSAAAVTSLVTGALLCLPLFLVAIITGIIGLATTGKPGVRGRGMAIGGLLLGILGLCIWSTGGYLMYKGGQFVSGYVQQFTALATNLQAGDLPASIKSFGTTMTDEQIGKFTADLAKFGKVKSVELLDDQGGRPPAGQAAFDLRARVTFDDDTTKDAILQVTFDQTTWKLKITNATIK